MQRQKAVRSSEITLMMLGPHPEEHSPVFDAAEIVWVHSYAATNAKGEYHVAFGIGDGMMLTEVANAALERASLFATDRTKLFVQLVDRRDTAARRVTHTLRDAEPGSLVFIGFRDSMLVDAGMAALHADPAITVIAPDGTAMRKLTAADRIGIRKAAAVIQGGMPAPRRTPVLRQQVFRARLGDQERLVGAALTLGPVTARHLEQIAERIGGGRVLLVEVLSPTIGSEGRSSISLSEILAEDQAEGVFSMIHAAADLATYQSIIAEFKAAGWPTVRAVGVGAPMEVNIMRANWTVTKEPSEPPY